MSSKSSSNKNIKDLREQINHLSLNLNPNEINSNNNSNNQTPLKNVYSNISSPHPSNSVQKLSELEEKLKSINLGPNIDNYYKSIKTENPGIIPQMRRMELLQRKMNLLQNTNEQNSKALQEILEIEMKERLRYPKYTIIQNTPLTPHEEIMNQIIQKKLGPGAGYSMDYPTVVFKNKNEIDEMRNIQESNNNINNNISNNNNFGSNRVVFQTNDNKPVTVKMIKEIQKEILNLRKAVSELKIQLKEMKNNFKSDLENDINSNKLLVEIIRKVIEEGGDNKLKSSVEKNFDRKKINIEEIKTDLEIFKTEELNDIIKEEINKYDKKMNKILDKMKNDLEKIINDKNILNNNDNINTNLKINLLEENNKISELNKNSTIKKEKSQSSKVNSKKSNSLNLKTDGKNSDNSNMKEEEEEEEDDNSDSDESKTYISNKKSKKNSSSHKSKTKSKKTSSKKSSSKMPSSGS